MPGQQPVPGTDPNQAMSAAEVKAKSYEFQRAEPTGMDNGAVAWRSLYVANELNEI